MIPTGAARGAQREARALADKLDAPGTRRHRVVSLFDGPDHVGVDISLRHPGAGRPGQGFDPRLAWRVRSLIAEHDPSLLVAHGSEPLKYLVPGALTGTRPLGRPLVYYAIGTYSGLPGRRLQIELWKLMIRRANAVIAEGEEVKEECIRLLGVPTDRVQFVPNGRDPDVFRPKERGAAPAAGVPLISFAGALTRGKAPDRFLELVSRLRARAIQFRAAMVGDGPLRREVEARAKAIGVEVLGSRSDVAELLRQSDILVFPSRPAGEGMPGILIEAGMSGVPVVATDVPGVHTIVEHEATGLIVPEDDLDAMTDSATRLLTDVDLRMELGRRARERCARLFAIDEVASQWSAVLQPLLSPTRPAKPR